MFCPKDVYFIIIIVFFFLCVCGAMRDSASISISLSLIYLFGAYYLQVHYFVRTNLTKHCMIFWNHLKKSTNLTNQLFNGTRILAPALLPWRTTAHLDMRQNWDFSLSDWGRLTQWAQNRKKKCAHQRSDCKTICRDEPAALCSECSTKRHSKQTGMCT